MDFQTFIEHPPEGCEVLAFHLRQAAAKLDQSRAAAQEAQNKVRLTEAQVNYDMGALEGLKRVAAQLVQAQEQPSDGGTVAEMAGDDSK